MKVTPHMFHYTVLKCQISVKPPLNLPYKHQLYLRGPNEEVLTVLCLSQGKQGNAGSSGERGAHGEPVSMTLHYSPHGAPVSFLMCFGPITKIRICIDNVVVSLVVLASH